MSNTVITTSMQGLQTYLIDVPNTDSYVVNVTNTLPTITTTGNVGSGAGSQPVLTSTPALQSSLITTIKHNSSTVYTSNAGDKSAYAVISATAGDSISIITSSSNAADEAINAIRSSISISEGNV
jgi:hypothetical protein